MRSLQIRSSTSESLGSMNGVTAPERANHSQATASATIENTRAKPQATVRSTRTAADFSGAVWSNSAIQRPLHDEEIDAVGGEAKERHREHDRKHRVIGAVGAEKSDEIAEPLLRHDQ